MTKTPNPNDFDFADWFGDVDVPEESTDVFTATNLLGEIGALQRQIEDSDRAAGAERSLGDEMDADEERLAELMNEFLASKRTIYIKGLTQGERTTARKQHEASHKSDEDFVERCLAASIVGMRKPGGDRTPVKLSLSDVQKLHKQLGDGQMTKLFQTYQQATSGIPTVDADFLLRRSGPVNTEE